MYLLGRSDQRDVTVDTGQKGSTGGKEQENPADYIEFIATSAAYHFFKEADKGTEAFDSEDDKGFFCISHDYGTEKLDFPLFGQEYGDLLKKKLGIAVAASVLDTVKDWFQDIAKENQFSLVKLDGEEFRNLKAYWGLFNYSVSSDETLKAGWLPQMYHGRGGAGLLFKETMFACKDKKSLEKFKYNEDLFAGENPPQYKPGGLFGMGDRFDKAKTTFNEVMIDKKTTLDDLLERTYATLSKLYFNE